MNRKNSLGVALLLGMALLYVLTGCEPVYTSSYQVINHTNQDLILTLHDSVNEAIAIRRNSSGEMKALSVTGDAPGAFSLDDKDSVSITDMDGSLLKVYFPGTGGKNIYDVDNPASWLEEEESTYHYVYSFIITEQDLAEE